MPKFTPEEEEYIKSTLDTMPKEFTFAGLAMILTIGQINNISPMEIHKMYVLNRKLINEIILQPDKET